MRCAILTIWNIFDIFRLFASLQEKYQVNNNKVLAFQKINVNNIETDAMIPFISSVYLIGGLLPCKKM